MQVTIENAPGAQVMITGDQKGSAPSQHSATAVIEGNWESLRRYMESLAIEKSDITDLKQIVEVENVSRRKKKSGFGRRLRNWIQNTAKKLSKHKEGISEMVKLISTGIQLYLGSGGG